MSLVNLKKARQRLGELVRAAEQGESTVITRRGKAVARIVPAEKKRRRRFPDLTAFRQSIKVRGKPLSRTVIDMRREEGC